jgi:hypothetical protein
MRPTPRYSAQNFGCDSRTSHTLTHKQAHRADRSNTQIHSKMNLRKKRLILGGTPPHGRTRHDHFFIEDIHLKVRKKIFVVIYFGGRGILWTYFQNLPYRSTASGNPSLEPKIKTLTCIQLELWSFEGTAAILFSVCWFDSEVSPFKF